MKHLLLILLLSTPCYAFDTIGKCDEIPQPEPDYEICKRDFNASLECWCKFDRPYQVSELKTVDPKIQTCGWETMCRHEVYPKAAYNGSMMRDKPELLGKAYTRAFLKAEQYDIDSRR